MNIHFTWLLSLLGYLHFLNWTVQEVISKVQMINFLKSIGMILSTQVVVPEVYLPSSVVDTILIMD